MKITKEYLEAKREQFAKSADQYDKLATANRGAATAMDQVLMDLAQEDTQEQEAPNDE